MTVYRSLMANQGHLAVLRKGVDEWNRWRLDKIRVRPDLRGAPLRSASLRGANFFSTDLSSAILIAADLRDTSFNRDATLAGADMRGADLRGAALLVGADLRRVDLRGADLRDAVLEADLAEANLSDADLRGADFRAAILTETVLTRALFSARTKWPAGYEAISHGAIVAESAQSDLYGDFEIAFAPELSPNQIKGTLTALAEYYRACGGIGFAVDFEFESMARERQYV